MIDVEIGPSTPRTFRHLAKDGVHSAVNTLVGVEALEQCQDLSKIGGELGGRSAAELRIDLGARADSGRPPHWRVQNNPLENRATETPARISNRFLPKRHQQRVPQMAHHLVRGHATPPPRTVGTKAVQPSKDLRLVAFLGEGFHGSGLLRRRHAPRIRSPPASRNAWRACRRPSSAAARTASNVELPRSASKCRLRDKVGATKYPFDTARRR